MSKVLCAAADKAAADRLKSALGQRGDVSVLIVSAALESDKRKDDTIRAALEALGRGKLVVVQLDETTPPLGLRDVQRFRWSPDGPDAAKEAEAIAAAVREAREREAADLSAPKQRRFSVFWTIIVLVVLAMLVILAASFVSSFLSQSVRADLSPDFQGSAAIAAVERAEVRGSLASVQLMVAAILAIQVLTIVVMLVRWLFGAFRRRRPKHVDGDGPAVAGLLFASYSRQDRERVDALIADIERQGLPVWLDRVNIGGGSTWPEAIVQAIKSSRALIIFCSPHAFESDNVLREVNLAAEYKKVILPIVLDRAQMPDSFHYYLSTRQIIDVTDDPNWRGKMMDALRRAA